MTSGPGQGGGPSGAAGHPFALSVPTPGAPVSAATASPPPSPEEPDHPLLKPVSDWLQLVSRALRATRFYPPASATRVQQMEAAVSVLPKLFGNETSFNLRVKEDRLLLAKKPVLVDEDRVNGLPYLLFANSIMQVGFKQGVTAQEVKAFLEAAVTDFSSEEHRGEDLATVLWRLDLQNIEYQHVDVLAAAFQAKGDELGTIEDPEVRRLRQDIEALMSALASNRADGSDFRVVFDRALESPESSNASALWEEQTLAWAAGALDTVLPAGVLSAFRSEVLEFDRPQIVSLRLLEHLLEDPVQNLGVLSRLVEGALKSHDFESSMLIMERLQGTEHMGGRGMTEAVHALLDRLGNEEQVGHAVEALIKSESKDERGRILSYLRLVGPAAAISILRVLDRVESTELLDALADVVADAAAQKPEIVEDLTGLSGRAVAALLRASSALEPSQRSALIWAGSSHGEVEVRLSVLEILAGFGPGHADTIVVNALRDSSPIVREKALAMAGERKIAAALPVISRLVRAREQEAMSPEFLAALLTAYARVGGVKVLSDLLRILNQTPKLSDLRRTAQLQADAAMAIATIDDESAREHLKKGAKSLNPALRKACKDALVAASQFGMTGPTLNLPLLGPRVETTLPTGVAAPARSSAPPPPLSSPPSRPPPAMPSSPPPRSSASMPSPQTTAGFGQHSVAPQHRSEAMPAFRGAAPTPPPYVELPMDALEPLEPLDPPPARRASIPPPPPKSTLSDDLFGDLELDE